MKDFLKKLVGEWLWILVGVVNVILALAFGAGVAGWSNDVSEIGGYTFLMMFLIGIVECFLFWTEENVPAAAISGGVLGTVLVLIIFQ